MIGADKLIAFDPPGSIGLSPDGAVVLLRFDEIDATRRPRDAAANLTDLVPGTWLDGTAAPPHPNLAADVVPGATGRARRFRADMGAGVGDGFPTTGLVASDRVSGATLLTRDLTIQTICRWDIAAAVGGTNTIVMRGVAYKMALVVVDVPARTGSLGGLSFTVPTGFTLLTMTRRWVSPSVAVYRYYIGDQLLGEVSGSGAIGGSTLDQFSVGFDITSFNPFVGDIDELAIYGYEMSREEIEATWLRITQYQPLGYQLLKEMHDPGFPISTSPDSDVQLETRQWGHAIGMAAAAAENLRANMLPTRAYGTMLEAWEQAVSVTPQPQQDIDTRRARAVARLRQRRGSSIDGFKDALEGLVGTDVGNLQFLAFDETVRDDFSAGIQAERWDVKPGAGTITAVAGAASFQAPLGSYVMDGATQDWLSMDLAIGGDGREVQVFTKLVLTTPQVGMEAGVYIGDWALGNYLLLGMRYLAPTLVLIYTESFVGHVSQAVTAQATFGANPAAIWLLLRQQPASVASGPWGYWSVGWATSYTPGYGMQGYSPPFTYAPTANLAGLYLRTAVGTFGAAARADFDDVVIRAPYGDRSLNAYVYRDPALPGVADVEGANSVVAAIKHAFVDGAFITSKSLLCDDDGSLCDRGPMGAL